MEHATLVVMFCSHGSHMIRRLKSFFVCYTMTISAVNLMRNTTRRDGDAVCAQRQDKHKNPGRDKDARYIHDFRSIVHKEL